jgi:hypothetical protein
MSTDLRQMIADASRQLGISPIDLATVISYETGGTLNPTQRGPTTQWGQHRGLIQWGEPQARKYLGGDFSIPRQGEGIVAYMKDAGVKPGMGLLDVYSAVNAGRVGRYSASDANNGGAPGTVADKVNNQMAGHRKKAESLMGGAISLTPEQAHFVRSNPQPGGFGAELEQAAEIKPPAPSGAPQGSNFADTGIPMGVADYASSGDGSPNKGLMGFFKALADTPDAPAGHLGKPGDAREAGMALLKFLEHPTMGDLLLKRRLSPGRA